MTNISTLPKETKTFKAFVEPERNREVLENDHVNHIRCRLQDALMMYAPYDWSTEKLEELEEQSMYRVRAEASRLPMSSLGTHRFLEQHVHSSVLKLLKDIEAQVAMGA